MPATVEDADRGHDAPAMAIANLDLWREIVSHEFNPLDVTNAEDRFAGSLRIAELGPDSTLSLITTSPSLVKRTQDGIKRSDDESLFLSLNLAATLTLAQDGRVVHLHRDWGAFTVSSKPYDLFCNEHSQQILLKVPRAAVPVARASQMDVLVRPLDAGCGELGFLRAFIRSLLTAGGTLGTSPAEVLWQTTIDLTALAIQAAVGEATPHRMERASIYHAMRAFVRNNANDSNLKPQMLAERFLISRRLVFQIFEENGTSPAAAIRSERLRRAAFLLRSTDARIRTIARQTGFHDLATFGRAFQREYGESPTKWRSPTEATGVRATDE